MNYWAPKYTKQNLRVTENSTILSGDLSIQFIVINGKIDRNIDQRNRIEYLEIHLYIYG